MGGIEAMGASWYLERSSRAAKKVDYCLGEAGAGEVWMYSRAKTTTKVFARMPGIRNWERRRKRGR